jgi:hypothetical protein
VNITFCHTDSESKRAPFWKTTPMFFIGGDRSRHDMPVDLNRSGVGCNKAQYAFHQHGLAAAGNAQQNYVITVREVEVHARQN